MNHKKTSAYLLLSVIAFIVCPFLGIFSLHHAIKAKNWEKTNDEQYESELEKSYIWARNTVIAFLCIGVVFAILLIVLYETGQ
jgi:NADH:ubiquinone oxidoreductase subunit 3 (subunit A)